MSGESDIIVVGAGPAGSRAAELLASRGFSVVLLDPRAPWEKPCGGGLTAAALAHTPELRELGDRAQEIAEVLVVGPSGASVVIPLRNPYVVVSRFALSRWGLERARAAGASFLPVAARDVERVPEGWVVADSAGGTHQSRWLVAADGATSPLRGVLAPRLKPELAPTRVVYPRVGSPAGRAVFEFLAAAQGYVWDFPRRDHHSVGIGVAPGTFRRPALDGALAQYRVAEADDEASADGRGAVIATSVWSSGGFSDLGGRDYALLGDAGGLADPATGEGIDYALRSAALAAEAFTPVRGFVAYPAAARRVFAVEMRRARLIRRWLYSPGVADQLVRRARRSPRAALLLMALADAVNEHTGLRGAAWRAVTQRPTDWQAARAVCDCPDGAGASAPSARGNAAASQPPAPAAG